jgi:glycosyltransferase involved in cell wall biosynthesis
MTAMSSADTPRHSISVVMPMRNAASTVGKTLASLFQQTRHFDELIIVDDASEDDSIAVVEKAMAAGRHEYVLLRHPTSLGLAASYNDGVFRSTGAFIVTLHSDVVLADEAALDLLVRPFIEQDDVVATFHQVDHPLDLWKSYNFWQKCFFARQAGVRQKGLDGKFDCFSREALLAVGLFDGKTFRRAGEDGDIVRKLSSNGKVVETGAVVLHLHSLDPHFGPRDIIFKHAQYAESQGALLRRYGHMSPAVFARTFFREILAVMLLLPWIRIAGTALIAVYAFVYSERLYLHEWRNPRALVVPLLNLLLLPVSLFFSLRGFVTRRQTL